MSDKEKDVNTEGHDEVTEDLSDFASSDEDLETHNPDIDEYDDILKELESSDEPTDDDTPGEAETTDEPEEGDDEGGEPGTKDEEEEQTVPYTRFKEVNDKMREYETELATMRGRFEAMEKAQPREPEPTPQSLPLDELLSGDPQAIVDSFTEDPAQFLNNLEARIKAQNAREYEERRAIEDQDRMLKSKLDEFASKHDDFIPSVPKLGETLGDNPIHNAISAYYEVVKVPTLEAQITDLQGQIESAKSEGIKQGRKEAIEAIRAKGLAATLDGSSSSEAPAPDTDLDDTESAGGTRNVLTKKLLERRKARGI
jgi:hypothetical protein